MRRELFGLSAFFVFVACLPAAEPKLKEFDASYLESPARGPQLDQVATAIIRSTNEYRKKEGREPLKVNDKLTRAARYFAAYMARTNKLEHEADGNRPGDRTALFEYEDCVVAENIAYERRSRAFTTKELGEAFFESWKTSPPHRENMLSPDVTEVGVAIGYDRRSGRYYAAQEMGKPKSAATRFEVRNDTPEKLHYTLAEVGHGKPAGKTFELGPHGSMRHERCQKSKFDWGWTTADDNVTAADRRVYVITKTERGYQVTERAASK